jgi:hypothetical protein
MVKPSKANSSAKQMLGRKDIDRVEKGSDN